MLKGRKAEVPCEAAMCSHSAGNGVVCSLATEMSLGYRADSFSCVGLIIFGITFEPFSYRIVKDNGGFRIALCGLSIVNKALVNYSQKSMLSFNLLGE